MSWGIRHVPSDWTHPRDGSGHYIPLRDQDQQTAMQDYMAELQAWADGSHYLYQHPYRDTPVYDRQRIDWAYFVQNIQEGPELHRYRVRTWTDAEATHYQPYHDINDGEPVGPVMPFAELLMWLDARDYAIDQYDKNGRPTSASSRKIFLYVGPRAGATPARYMVFQD